MGRPSLAAQRREQVLSAFARCVARAGFAGTSLESVAEEAGLARGHVRHYLGNRHDQVVALCEWVSTADQAEFARVLDSEDPASRFAAVLHYLFDPSFYTPGEDLDVYLALFEEARRDDALRAMFLDSYVDILDTTAKAVGGSYPHLTVSKANDAAYLLLCAAIGNAHLSQMGMKRSFGRRLGATCLRAITALTSV